MKPSAFKNHSPRKSPSCIGTPRSRQRQAPGVSRHLADTVYQGIVDVLKAPDGDCFIVIKSIHANILFTIHSASARCSRLTPS